MYKPIYLALFVISVLCQDGVVIPDVPCPPYFKYVVTPFKDVEGVIIVPYNGSSILNLEVNTSMRGYFGPDSTETQVTLLTPRSEIDNAKHLRYRIAFPVPQTVPRITSIVFNNREYCPGPPIIDQIPESGNAPITNTYAKLSTQIR